MKSEKRRVKSEKRKSKDIRINPLLAFRYGEVVFNGTENKKVYAIINVIALTKAKAKAKAKVKAEAKAKAKAEAKAKEFYKEVLSKSIFD